MDGDVHVHRRPAVQRRLSICFIIIVATLTNCSGHNPPVPPPDDTIAIGAVIPPITMSIPAAETPRFDMDTFVKARAMHRVPSKPTVKVKMRYPAIIHQASIRHGVESAMIKAIIMAESSYNPRAVSNRGAIGLMQLMPTTADAMGIKDLFDPKHNIDAGVRYFKGLLERFEGDIRLALAAYHAGAQKVRQYNGIPPYRTTRSYIEKVFQYYRRYKDLENKGSGRDWRTS